ncbi:MAG: hypothetical protein PHC98_05285, partial [Syntrophotalea acetylenica]|nr:hypothetical protein [Syntrophotalea acetylenica]
MDGPGRLLKATVARAGTGMLRTRFIVIAWLLLLVPTLLIRGVALRLLGNEQQQLAAESREAARRRAMSAAE